MQGPQRVRRGLPQLLRTCKKRWTGPCCGNIPVQFFYKTATVLVFWKTFISVGNVRQKSVRMPQYLWCSGKLYFVIHSTAWKIILKYQTFLVNGCYRSQLYLWRDSFFLCLPSHGSNGPVIAFCTTISVWERWIWMAVEIYSRGTVLFPLWLFWFMFQLSS